MTHPMAQRLFIPPLGSIIQLKEDWRFRLYDEQRNETVQKACGLYPPFRQGLSRYLHQDVSKDWREMDFAQRAAEIAKTGWNYTQHKGMRLGDYWAGEWDHEFIFRKDTELKIDRYYIRQGLGDFDSVTFRTNHWVSAPGDPLFKASRKVKSLRFWAKLSDVNQIVGRILT